MRRWLSLGISPGAVTSVMSRANMIGYTWDGLDDLNDEALEQRLCGPPPSRQHQRVALAFGKISPRRTEVRIVMSENPLTFELGHLATERLVELVEDCFWRSLADDVPARARFEDIGRELENRESVSLLREAVSRVAAAVTAHREKINRSPGFRSARRLQEILQFIVKHTLLGKPAKRASLAVEVYGAKRAEKLGEGALSKEVGRLRETLEKYYQGPGLGDPLRLRIPKRRGGYVVIVSRTAVADVSETLGAGPTERPAEIQVVPLNSLRGMSAFPAFSPSGSEVAFSWNHDQGGYNFDVFVQSIGTATPRQITSKVGAVDISPAWSPNGCELAFLRLTRGRCEVRIAAAASGDDRKVADVFAARYEILGRQLAWSPDGAALAVVDKPASEQPFAIALISLATVKSELLTRPPAGIVGDSDPAFAPDGRALAFVRTEATGVKDVFVLPRGADDPVRLTFDHKHVYGLCWLPDSSSLVVSSARAGMQGLWKIGLAGEPPERLPGIGERALHPACSGGGRLAYTNLVVSTSIWELPLANSKQTQGLARRFIYSTRSDVNPDFSPDGIEIAFASDRSGTFEIWVCAADSTNAVKLTSFESAAGTGTPRWSPNGERIAFDCRAEGHAHVFILTPKTGRLQRLTKGPSENVVPSWSSDGRFIYFSSNRSGQHQIWRISTEGGDAEQRTRWGGFAPMESPDAEFLYYAKGRTAQGLWRMSVTSLQEEPVVEMLKPTFWGLWALSSEGIYFLDSDIDGPPPCTLKFLDLGTRSLAQIAVLEGIKRVHYQGLAISPDRQRILYPQLEESSGEIMLATILP